MRKIAPKKGQESVWDYPRPPRMENFNGNIVVKHAGKIIINTNRSFRILETSHPPVYYIPLSDEEKHFFVKNDSSSFCEWKGLASYYDLKLPGCTVENVGWFYEKPKSAYTDITGAVALYASRVDECRVNDEKVMAQEGDFYGGWITSNIVGPFKGAPGTWGW
jgi:uncharacterized protein (DUF427 family)